MPSINLLRVISDNTVWLVSVELSVTEHLLGWKPINKPNISVYISHSRATCFPRSCFPPSTLTQVLISSELSLYFPLWFTCFLKPMAQQLHYSSCWFLLNLLTGFNHPLINWMSFYYIFHVIRLLLIHPFYSNLLVT